MLVIVLLVTLVSLFIISVIWCSKEITSSCNYHVKTTPYCLLHEHVLFEEDQQNLAKEHVANSSVVICGLVRDSKESLIKSLPMILEFGKMFKKYKIVIVENDSVDGTRELLLDYANKDPNVVILGCGINSRECSMKLDKTIDHEVSSYRIRKMSFLRNIYLNYTKKNFPDYNYLMVYDFDIKGNVYLDGFLDTMYLMSENKNIDGVTANGVRDGLMGKYYYDTFAIFSKESPSCFPNSKKKKKDEKNILVNNILPSKSSNKFFFSSTYNLIEVKSAFAGLGIYRMSSVLSSGASYSLKCNEWEITCEHTPFSEDLGNVFINPRMTINVTSH